MDSSQGDVDIGGRKFQLPGWMVQGVERLNTATDLDQYACSVLESEGYISECSLQESSGEPNSVPSSGLSGASDVKNCSRVKLASECTTKDSLSAMKLSAVLSGTKLNSSLSPKHLSAIDVIKCEEGLYSSPDTTPCVTPEQSPAPQRKKSFSSPDTVQSNPQKWFYLGTTRNAIKPKQLKRCLQQVSSNDLPAPITDGKKKEQLAHCSNSGVKLTISNFDLNAISPSSW